MRVLLAEDDRRLGKLVQYMLEQNKIKADWVTNGSEVYEYAMYTDYDILILDWMMPGENGIDVCKRLRSDGYAKAILMLTARDSVEDRVSGLDAGADDYLVKPFRPAVLLARIEANLRRSQMIRTEHPVLRAGPLEMDTSVRTARKSGDRLNLSPTEYELLYYFMSNPGRFIPFDEIYQAVWQRPSIGDVRALFVHVSHLRQKIEGDPNKPVFIRTHLRDGYIFSDGSGSDSQGR